MTKGQIIKTTQRTGFEGVTSETAYNRVAKRATSMLGAALINCIGLSIVILFLSSPQSASGQTNDRVIPFPEWSAASDEDDVVLELVGIKIGERQITLGETFRSDRNWLKEMKLSVRNVSKKTIVSFGIGGGLLEGINKELESHQSFEYGIGWGWKAGAKSKKSFRPGETIELNYSDVNEPTKKVLAKVGEGAFYKLKFMAPVVNFKRGDASLTPKMRFNVG